MSEFVGSGKTFSEGAIEEAAVALGCHVAAVRAVIDVESRGGFLSDRRPKILFERHYFSRLTNRRHDAGHPEVSQPSVGGHRGGAREYNRLDQAIRLNRNAALRSASWGAFQIMGDNFKVCGFADVEDFIAAMVESEDRQLEAFVAFVQGNNLDDELRRLDWEGFARGYNGPNFRRNKYDRKMAKAYAVHAAGGPRSAAAQPAGGSQRPAAPQPAAGSLRATGVRPPLKMGSSGEDVEDLQRALGLEADGDFGPATKQAVIAFQRKHRLKADGVVVADTWRALASRLASA
jgi:hypothetical protein